MTVALSVAVGSYDHVRDFTSGRVRAEGIEPTFLQLGVEETLQRFMHHREWDVSEFSLAQLVSLRSRDDDSVVGLPVFLSRVFRHGSIYVREDSVSSPQQLAGGRIGIPEWTQTAGVWIRGILSSQYGVDLTSIRWTQAGLNEAGRREGAAPPPAGAFEIDSRPEASLNELLLDGEIDAILTARPPRAFDVPNAGIVRLIEDYPRVEREWWARTGLFPIMHVMVMRRDAYERARWTARNLTAAFTEAKRRSVARLADATVSRVALPWVPETLAGFAGEGEWWPYGIEANRTTLEAFVDFAHRQGIARRRVAIEELFAEETVFESRI